MKYTVWVDDERHFVQGPDDQKRGEFDTPDAAIAAARRIVDAWLRSRHVPGMSAEELFEGFKQYGEDPVVVDSSDQAGVDFSAWEYARQRCEEICGEPATPEAPA